MTVVVVTGLFKTQQTVLFKLGNFTVCKLYLHRVDLKEIKTNICI